MMSLADLPIVLLSLKVALVATLISLPPAILVAFALARGRFWGREIVNAIVHLPLVVPPVVTGFLLLRTLGPHGVIGAWLQRVLGITVAFRWTGAAIAAAVMGFPLMVRAIRLAIEAVDERLEDAAATLGATPLRVALTISLPLALPGVISGALLAFAKGMGEFGATITFVSNIPGETQTLALAIYSFLESPGGDAQAMRLVWLSIAVSFTALIASEVLTRRSLARRSVEALARR